MARELIIFGARAFADLARYYFTHDSPYRVVAFCVDAAHLQETTHEGLPVIATEEIVHAFPPDRCDLFVAVGIGRVNMNRAEKMQQLQALGYRLAGFCSSRAHVHPDLVVRPNVMIMEHAILQPFIEVGAGAVIWSGTRIAFRTRVEDYCWLTSGLIGETSVIGEGTFVGLGATIAPFVKVGRQNIIGAGALIMKDTKDYQVFRGPAAEASPVPSTRLWR
jgi:sugar O-acyltransferase (sialic acid O-acetyltransferase NeuD family)